MSRSNSESARCTFPRNGSRARSTRSARHIEYRLSQLPDRDSDERMKLALWCLNLKLTAEARELLNIGSRAKPQ